MTTFTSVIRDSLCFANSRTQAVFAYGLLQHECSSFDPDSVFQYQGQYYLL